MANHRNHTIDLLLLMVSTRLDMPRIQSYIDSMRNNDFNNKIYLERKKCITTSITSFNTLE